MIFSRINGMKSTGIVLGELGRPHDLSAIPFKNSCMLVESSAYLRKKETDCPANRTVSMFRGEVKSAPTNKKELLAFVTPTGL
jgi:hypothetical protein